MNAFSEYMGRVRAEPELKEKTKVFVRAALAGEAAAEPLREPEAGRPARKRFRLAVSLAAACLMLTVGGYACYVTPVNYVCVDINPSVEFSVNLFGRVVRAQAYNEDGAQLLEEGGYVHASVEKAVRALVEEAAAEGYLTGDGSSVIAVTAESRSGKTALKLQSAGEAGAALALRSAEQSAVVYADCSDLQLRTQAREAGVSPGKYRLIRMLQALDPGIDMAQYQNAKVTDIIAAMDALMARGGNAWQSSGDAAALERVRAAAQEVRKAGEAARQGQNGNGGQSQAPLPEEDRQDWTQAGNGNEQQQAQSHGDASQQAWNDEPSAEAAQGQAQNGSAQVPDPSPAGAESAQAQDAGGGAQTGAEDTGSENGASSGAGQNGEAASGPESAGSAAGGGASSGAQAGSGAGGGK